MSEPERAPEPEQEEPVYPCRWCDDGLQHGVPTMALQGDRVITATSSRRCKACGGTGLTSSPPDVPPMP